MYQLPSNITVQIVQQHPVDVPVIRCLVVETRRVFRCGMSHHAYGSTTVSFGKKIFPTRQECEMMIENQVGSISGRVIPLNANSTTHAAFVSEGTMDSDGGCTTSTFVRNNVEYKYSVETVEVIKFFHLLFATHMICFKIWLFKFFTYNFRQPSPLAR